MWSTRVCVQNFAVVLCGVYEEIVPRQNKQTLSYSVDDNRYNGVFVCCVKVVKALILPVLRAEADRLQTVLEGPLGNNTDRIAADHVKVALLVCHVLLSCSDTVTVTLLNVAHVMPCLGPSW